MVIKGRLVKRVSLRDRSEIIYIHGPKRYTPREKLQDCIWIVTIGDPDDKPSVPHAHAREIGYRLNAWTGDIYPAGSEREKTIGKLKKKELSKLHTDSDFLAFTKKQIEWYRSANPHIRFYVPEWFDVKTRQLHLVAINHKNEDDKFVFLGRAVINKVYMN
ncbi:hypothetical protein [Petrocella sp. FN5]|uniref:hypothetical protein n=1 Tax=Petrocella sp. FN5 TaxID=3032002 RepID=UPI0023DA3662|nr:hypothetical protein [Petrocella sp. FN5]MDF1617980.1 hypothetical protein [Petrocella sp. FN5]